MSYLIEDQVLISWRADDGLRDGLPGGRLGPGFRMEEERRHRRQAKKLQSVHCKYR
jgi:hypothetical protein